MVSQSQIVERVMADVTDGLASQASAQFLDAASRDALLSAVRASLASSVSASLAEGEFYRQINDGMRQGLQNMYKEIATVASTSSPAIPDKEATGRLFSEAADQLQEVMDSTLEATENIMGTVEDIQDMLQETDALLASIQSSIPADAAQKLTGHVTATEEGMTRIMTALSFQDLTGQRLKKVVKALGDIQNSIFEMYVSSGLMLKTREEAPEKDIEEIARESRRRLEEIKGSELKGPTKDSSQGDVDSLLADLGL